MGIGHSNPGQRNKAERQTLISEQHMSDEGSLIRWCQAYFRTIHTFSPYAKSRQTPAARGVMASTEIHIILLIIFLGREVKHLRTLALYTVWAHTYIQSTRKLPASWYHRTVRGKRWLFKQIVMFELPFNGSCSFSARYFRMHPEFPYLICDIWLLLMTRLHLFDAWP